MKRSFFWISSVLIILALTGLACNMNLGGAKEPTATPLPPTSSPSPEIAIPLPDTATPEPTLAPTETVVEIEPTEAPSEEQVASTDGMVQVENETFGIRLSYPEEWFYDDSFFIMISSDPEADPMAAEEMPDSLVIIALSGSAEEMEVEGGITEETLEEITQELSGSGESEIVKGPWEETINGVPVQLLEFTATEEGKTGHGKMALFDDGERVAVFVALCPEELWNEYADAVDDVLFTIELFEGKGFEFDFGESIFEGVYRGDLFDGDYTEDRFENDESHSWNFSGRAGQFVTVVLTPFDEEMDVILQLVDPDGLLLVEVDNSFSQEAEILANYELGQDGEYQIIVADFFGQPGAYSLEFSLLDEMKMVIPPGVMLMDSIDLFQIVEAPLEEGQEHAWTFSASAGDIINIFLNPLDEGMDMSFSVLSPDGSYLLEAHDEAFSDEAEEYFSLVLDNPGVYTIVVDEYWDMEGSYSLMIEMGDENAVQDDEDQDFEIVEMGVINYGEAWEANLPQGSFAHMWDFEGEEGDQISIFLYPETKGIDLMLALIDPDGESIFEVDDTMSDETEEIVNYSLPLSGVFSIAIAEFYELEASYTLSLEMD